MKIKKRQLNKLIKTIISENVLTDREERDKRRREREKELAKLRQDSIASGTSTGPHSGSPQAERAYYRLGGFLRDLQVNINLYVEIMENFENVTRINKRQLDRAIKDPFNIKLPFKVVFHPEVVDSRELTLKEFLKTIEKEKDDELQGIIDNEAQIQEKISKLKLEIDNYQANNQDLIMIDKIENQIFNLEGDLEEMRGEESPQEEIDKVMDLILGLKKSQNDLKLKNRPVYRKIMELEAQIKKLRGQIEYASSREYKEHYTSREHSLIRFINLREDMEVKRIDLLKRFRKFEKEMQQSLLKQLYQNFRSKVLNFHQPILTPSAPTTRLVVDSAYDLGYFNYSSEQLIDLGIF